MNQFTDKLARTPDLAVGALRNRATERSRPFSAPPKTPSLRSPQVVDLARPDSSDSCSEIRFGRALEKDGFSAKRMKEMSQTGSVIGP